MGSRGLPRSSHDAKPVRNRTRTRARVVRGGGFAAAAGRAMSQFFDLDGVTLWNPSNGAARLFLRHVALPLPNSV